MAVTSAAERVATSGRPLPQHGRAVVAGRAFGVRVELLFPFWHTEPTVAGERVGVRWGSQRCLKALG